MVDEGNARLQFLMTAHIVVPCVVFVLSSYASLYFETRRHQRKIKTQQPPQQEKENFIRERKSLKTTALVVCAVLLCLMPEAIYLLLKVGGTQTEETTLSFVGATFVMLNALINPLIYSWRQKEMRKFVLSPNQCNQSLVT